MPTYAPWSLTFVIIVNTELHRFKIPKFKVLMVLVVKAEYIPWGSYNC